MTIFDIDGNINLAENCVMYGPARSERRGGLSAEVYKSIIDVYYLVSESYIHFFNENWFADNLEETNRRIMEDLQKNMSPSLTGNCFESQEQAKEVAEYVLTLPFPADLDTMKALFAEVMKGRLEFRCRYPIGETNAKELINGLGLFGIS